MLFSLNNKGFTLRDDLIFGLECGLHVGNFSLILFLDFLNMFSHFSLIFEHLIRSTETQLDASSGIAYEALAVIAQILAMKNFPINFISLIFNCPLFNILSIFEPSRVDRKFDARLGLHPCQLPCLLSLLR